MNSFCVYRYIRLDKNIPFYIGKAKNFERGRLKSTGGYLFEYPITLSNNQKRL